MDGLGGLGIGVLVGAVATVVLQEAVGDVYRHIKSRLFPPPTPKPQQVEITLREPSAGGLVPVPPTAKELRSQVESGPPITWREMGKNVGGMHVCWAVAVEHISERPDQLTLQTRDAERECVMVNVAKEAYPRLRVAPVGQELLVSGHVTEVENLWTRVDADLIEFVDRKPG